MKSCSVCKRTDVQFHKNKTKADGLQSICTKCKKEQGAKYFQDSKQHHKELNYNRKREIRQWVFDYLKVHGCVDCPETDPVVLDFDHNSDKFMDISGMIRMGYSIEKIKTEISKCSVRCANCHRRKTARDFDWYKDLI